MFGASNGAKKTIHMKCTTFRWPLIDNSTHNTTNQKQVAETGDNTKRCAPGGRHGGSTIPLFWAH